MPTMLRTCFVTTLLIAVCLGLSSCEKPQKTTEITKGQFLKVTPGMTRDQVKELVGKPGEDKIGIANPTAAGPNPTPEEVEEHARTTTAEVWEYKWGDIRFNLKGEVME